MHLKSLVAGAVLAFSATQGLAQTILTLTGPGKDGETTSVEYSMADLDALEQTEFTSINSFVDQPTVYSGALLRDLLTDFDLDEDGSLTLRALNDYEVSMPISDTMDYDVIVASKVDGELMSVREKGPLWIIYPVSDHDELQDSIYSGRMIWQLEEITVQ